MEDSILNQMDSDELRSYALHLSRENNAIVDFTQAQAEMCHSLEDMCRALKRLDETRRILKAKEDFRRDFERAMLKKYANVRCQE